MVMSKKRLQCGKIWQNQQQNQSLKVQVVPPISNEQKKQESPQGQTDSPIIQYIEVEQEIRNPISQINPVNQNTEIIEQQKSKEPTLIDILNEWRGSVQKLKNQLFDKRKKNQNQTDIKKYFQNIEEKQRSPLKQSELLNKNAKTITEQMKQSGNSKDKDYYYQVLIKNLKQSTNGETDNNPIKLINYSFKCNENSTDLDALQKVLNLKENCQIIYDNSQYIGISMRKDHEKKEHQFAIILSASSLHK